MTVTPADYKREREARGSQSEVAAMLGVHKLTLSKRETGEIAITREAWLALRALRKPRKANAKGTDPPSPRPPPTP